MQDGANSYAELGQDSNRGKNDTTLNTLNTNYTKTTKHEGTRKQRKNKI